MFRKMVIAFFFTVLFSCSPKYLKKHIPSSDPCRIVSQADTLSVAYKLGLSETLMKTKTGIYSLENGGESFIIRDWLFENAQKTIDIQYYMFLGDQTGLVTADYLIHAADRGVKIRLILDDATAKKGSHEIYALDWHPNIEVKVYNPGVKLGSLRMRIMKLLTRPRRFERRMHNKTITIDGQVAITGGRNIADEYSDYDRRYNFRDRDVLLAGKEVAAVTTSFDEFWNNDLSVSYKNLVRKKKKFDKKRFNRIHAFACDEKNFSRQMKEKIKNFPSEFA
ncbi:MAG: phospholipase D-like domain-containing protein, partial [Bacteroidia bacterium]